MQSQPPFQAGEVRYAPIKRANELTRPAAVVARSKWMPISAADRATRIDSSGVSHALPSGMPRAFERGRPPSEKRPQAVTWGELGVSFARVAGHWVAPS